MRNEGVAGAGGGKFGGGAARTPKEAPNTLRSIATARVIDLIGEGEIVGLVNGLKSVYFDDTPLQDSNGAFNFANVTVETRTGLPDQAPLNGFSDIESEAAVGVKVVQATPVVRTVDNTDADACRVKIRIPALSKADTKTGDINPNSLALTIEAKGASGSYVQMVSETIQGKCTSPYEKAYYIALGGLGAGPWSIRLTRVTADYDTVATVGELWFGSLTTIIEHKLIYPDSALVGITCDAQAFGGSVPTRSYEIYGLKFQVPVNYDPATRAYSGSWNGTFKTAFSDNPAWVFYALATNERFGLGEFLAAAQLDKWSLYQIAQYCDQLVPDGKGGTEPRYTFNGVIADRDDAYRVLLSLASVFRGLVFWSSGTVFATADMPADPVKLVTPANVIGGIFKYEGAALKARHSAVLVSWSDPADGYKPNIEVVEDVEAIDAFGYRPLEMTAVGCTSRGQARRYGEWVLQTERYESEVLTYQCSFDHADLVPGNIISVADPAYAGLRMGGRLGSATLTSLTLDAAVTIDALQTYSVDVVVRDGSIETRELTNAGGVTDTLTFASPLPSVPTPGAIWILTAGAVEPRPFRVVSITETDKHLFEVSAALHSPGKYDRVEQNLVVEDPNYTILPSGPLAAPLNLATSQYLYESGAGALVGAVTASWSGAPDPRVMRYEVQVSRRGLDYVQAAVVAETSLDITDIAQSETAMGVRVRALDDLGRYSPWLVKASVGLSMFTARPANVAAASIRASVQGESMGLTWDPVTTLGLSHYIIRYSPATDGATWDTAQVIQAEVVGTSAQVNTASGTFLIKAVSLAGVESASAAAFVSLAGGLVTYNAVETLDPAPTWAGTLTDVEIDSDDLTLSAGETEGLYELADGIDLGAVYVSRVTAASVAVGLNPNNVMSGWPSLTALTSLSGADPSQWLVRIEERHTADDPGGSPTWSDWAALTTNNIGARAFQFRMHLTSLDGIVTPKVSSLAISVDMPDRHIVNKDLASGTGAGGYAVTFDPPFHSLKGVLVTPADLASGDRWEFVAKDETGFTIRFKDSGGTIVSRTFDSDAIGFGAEVT